MKPRLIEKLAALRQDLDCGHFILADAKDADMAWGISSPGQHRARRFIRTVSIDG